VCFATENSLGGSKYFVTLKDEASGFRMVSFVKTKDKVYKTIKAMLKAAYTKTKVKAVLVRTNNGTEFCTSKVAKLLCSKGIKHECCAPYVKQGNGIAKQENCTLCNMAQCLLFQTNFSMKLKKSLWAEAVNTAAYLLNRIPNKQFENMTPFECWNKSNLDIGHLKTFGTITFVKVPEEHRC
jgi:transposase InsO family protein